MGRSSLAVMALVVCSRIVLADSVAHRALERGFASPMDSLTTLALSLGHATTFKPKVATARRARPVEGAQQVVPGETSLDDLMSSPAADIEPGGLFDDGSDLVLGGGAPESLDAALVDADGEPGPKFDWPDLSGVVELLVAQSSRELVAKYRLPGHENADEAKKKKKKTKEELMALAKCRRTPRSPFSQSFHILAAAFIGTFLVIVVLRRSGKGSYWW